MVLIKSKECDSKISDKTKKCVNCDCSIKETNVKSNMDKSKILISVLIGILLLILGLGGYFVYAKVLNDKDNAKDSNKINNKGNKTIPMLDKSYIGSWGDSEGCTDRYDSSCNVLTISEINEDTINFSLLIFRITDFETTAKLENNKLKFTGSVMVDYKVSGILIFDNNTITVIIEQSDFEYISHGDEYKFIYKCYDPNNNENNNQQNQGETHITSIENGTVAYFNPQTNQKCNDYIEANSNTGNKIGCLKWYAFENVDDKKINLLLDHNTTATVKWSSTGSNTTVYNGMLTNLQGKRGDTVHNQLETDVSNWHTSVKETVRLLEANEVAKITNHPTFNQELSDQSLFYFGTNDRTRPYCDENNLGIGYCIYGWLYDRTGNGCSKYGCLNNTAGMNYGSYWTSNPDIDSTGSAWMVNGYGYLGSSYVTTCCSYGVRPVITILKSDL